MITEYGDDSSKRILHAAKVLVIEQQLPKKKNGGEQIKITFGK